MKIVFIFTDKPNLALTPRTEWFRSSFELPDVVSVLPDAREQAISIGERIGEFTQASLHINAPEIGLRNHTIKQVTAAVPLGGRLLQTTKVIRLYFEGYLPQKRRRVTRNLTIYAPILPPFPRLNLRFYSVDRNWPSTEMQSYSLRMKELGDSLLTLLHADDSERPWHLKGFNPYLIDNRLINRLSRHIKKEVAQERRRERETEKRKQPETKLAEREKANSDLPKHGSGRTPGARPGIYKGVQMRSQLEIRFAAELDERSIRWVYESKALGDSGYLVDFFLPDLDVWVEVKGKFEARDRQVLPEVSRYLEAEEKQRLLIYTGSGKCFVVNPTGFHEIERKGFWYELSQ